MDDLESAAIARQRLLNRRHAETYRIAHGDHYRYKMRKYMKEYRKTEKYKAWRRAYEAAKKAARDAGN